MHTGSHNLLHSLMPLVGGGGGSTSSSHQQQQVATQHLYQQLHHPVGYLHHLAADNGNGEAGRHPHPHPHDADGADDHQLCETNGPPTAGDREQAFHALRAKMGHLEEVIEDIGQFVCENQLEDHFISFVFRLSAVSKELHTEISTVENYLDFIVRPPHQPHIFIYLNYS